MWNLSAFFQRRDHVALPQNDTENAAKRKKCVEDACLAYIWDQKEIKGASMVAGLPDGEYPQFGWIETMVPIIVRVAINNLINSSEENENSSFSVLKLITSITGRVLAAITMGSFGPNTADQAADSFKGIVSSKKNPDAGTIEHHKELFENIKLDVVAKGNQFLQDDIFGWYRVAGPNPMRLTKCASMVTVTKLFPELTDTIVQDVPGFLGDSLAAMLAQNRLYYVSYPEFQNVKTGNDIETGKQKKNYIYAPSCLLAVPRNSNEERLTVLPIAIRCGQEHSYPMYTASRKHTDHMNWLAAKTTVQVADAVIHETVYHLARTHLLVGIFVGATHRALPESHPVFRLLKCHFYGTQFINYSATKRLINPGGKIDRMTAPDIYVTRSVSAEGINGASSLFNDWFLDVDMKSRDVLDPVLHYPYRDDALKIWGAILKWVGAYISAYYKSDTDIAADFELQNWCKELVDSEKGNLHGFGDIGDGKVKTVKYLTKAVAHVIFTATAQHASVNFPQGTLMQFSPAMPLAGYEPPPQVKPAEMKYTTKDDLSMKMFPTLDKSETQLNVAELIGVCQYTCLGDYGRSLEFAPDEVMEAMEEFQLELGSIGGDIQKRNKVEKSVGLPVYKFLAPNNIPNSINI